MAEPKLVELPYKPRNWARAMHASTRRFMALVLHRRAGKTTSVLNHHQRAALSDDWERRRLLSLEPSLTDAQLRELIKPPGGRHYAHIMPLHTQAKSVAWDKLKYYSECVPGAKRNESELLIRYPNGNKLQLFGADNPDAFRGMAFSGLSLDEYSQMLGNVFSEVLSKALADHLGYAIFCGTIRGRDQLYQSYQAAKSSDDWFALWQDIDRSIETEDGVTIKVLRTAMEDDRKLVAQGLMTQDEFDQEWYLSTEAAIQGAWYRNEMATALKEGRITRVPWEPGLPVDTDWDIGMVDAAALIYSQTTRSGEVRIIDYDEAEGEALPYFINRMRQKPYVYGKHYPPWDSTIKQFGSGKSTIEVAAQLGLKFEYPAKNPGVLPGIDAVRLLLPKVWFDAEKASRLIECLRNYRKTFNSRLDTYTGVPVHDWACVTEETEVLTRYGTHMIKSLPYQGEVLTPCGWKRYENPRITRRNAPLVAVTFEDGLTVKCTPEHRFLTAKGWRFAAHLQKGSEIQSCLTLSPSTLTEAYTGSGLKSVITLAGAKSFIGLSGQAHSGRFQTEAISTIGIATLLITCWPIWSVYQRLSISVIATLLGLMARSTFLPLPALARQRGTGLRLDAYGIEGTPSGLKGSQSGKGNLIPASGAEQSSTSSCGISTHKNTAPNPAKPLLIASVRPISETADVWCLTVPDGHMWPLANGAMTHNSHGSDAMRGLAVRHQGFVERKRQSSAPSREEFAWS